MSAGDEFWVVAALLILAALFGRSCRIRHENRTKALVFAKHSDEALALAGIGDDWWSEDDMGGGA